MFHGRVGSGYLSFKTVQPESHMLGGLFAAVSGQSHLLARLCLMLTSPSGRLVLLGPSYHPGVMLSLLRVDPSLASGSWQNC